MYDSNRNSARTVLLCLVAQSCLTLCDPIDCSPPGFSVHGDSPGKNTGVGCHALLQGIFPTQGSNPGHPHCRWILYRLSHTGKPKNEWGAFAFSSRSSNPGIEPRSPAFAGGFLSSEPRGKPILTSTKMLFHSVLALVSQLYEKSDYILL